MTLDRQIHQLGEEIRQQSESVQQAETEHSERTQRGYAIETETRQNRDRLNQIAIEGDRGKARIRTNEERCAELIVRMASAESELAQTQARLAALEQERDGHQQSLDSAAADLTAAQQEYNLSQQETAHAAIGLAMLEQEQEAHRAAILEAVGGASNLRNQLTQSEERLAGIGREEQRLRVRDCHRLVAITNVWRTTRPDCPGI